MRIALPAARAARALSLALLPLVLTACGDGAATTSSAQVSLGFEPGPVIGDTTCVVRLTDEDGAALAGASVAVEGNMNHAGMVPVFADLAEATPGEYRGAFRFTMGGDWFVVVRAELSDGSKLEEIVDVPGVRKGSGSAGS